MITIAADDEQDKNKEKHYATQNPLLFFFPDDNFIFKYCVV